VAKWKKATLGTALTFIFLIGVGYVTAWLSLASCADDTFREIQIKDISGMDMFGKKIALTRSNVSSKIVGPFLVETRFMVPYDLHGSIHLKQYYVFPWGRHERSSDIIELVMTPAALRSLISNYAIKGTSVEILDSSERSSGASVPYLGC